MVDIHIVLRHPYGAVFGVNWPIVDGVMYTHVFFDI